jgi:hypothetical protein
MNEVQMRLNEKTISICALRTGKEQSTQTLILSIRAIIRAVWVVLAL